MRIVLFLCILLLPWPANADEILREAVEVSPQAVAAVDNMSIRAEPDLDSEIIARPQLMWPLTLLTGTAPEVIVNGRKDRWVRVAFPVCVDSRCETYRSGWTLDSFLGFNGRFERLTGLVPTTVGDDDERNVLAYGVRADGQFTRWSALCIPGMCNLEPGLRPDCPEAETRRGAFCVMTGVLYRYRDLVRGKGVDGNWLPFGLTISLSRGLCALGPDRGIDWKGGYITICIHSVLEPAAAVEARMDEKRKRLALVAVDMVGLRAEPSADAAITGRLPLGAAVTTYGQPGALASLNSWHGRWISAWVTRCRRALEGCAERASGWLIDGVLAFEDRLLPMAGWREGVIGGRAGNRTFRYETALDGKVVFSEACTDPLDCGEITASGRLYRYENLVVAKFRSIGRVDILYIDENGGLCLPELNDGSISYELLDGKPSRCDR